MPQPEAQTPQDRGRDFEVEAAESLGLRLTPGSGNGAERSDAQGPVRLSCKSSSNKVSWAEVKRHVAEAVDMAYGTGEIPALAMEDEHGGQYLVMRLEDAGKLLSQESTVQHRPRRGERLKAAADVPMMLRD